MYELDVSLKSRRKVKFNKRKTEVLGVECYKISVKYWNDDKC